MHGDISALALLLYFTVLEKLKLEKVPIDYFFGKYSCFISLRCVYRNTCISGRGA